MSLYQEYEVQVSRSQLSKVLSELDGPVCLLGGWAVYLTVNGTFSASEGRNFMGSRDIDLGFHVNPAWADADLKNSVFAKAVKRIAGVGFRPVSFRFVKHFHTETRKELSEEQAKKVNQAFIFDMYVDPIVDRIHPRSKQVFGFVPIDEPLLSQVFGGMKSTLIEEFGAKLLVPKASVLLAMKLNSVSSRDKEHKRIKDIADIYGLLWYSGEEFRDLKSELFSMVARQRVFSVVNSFKQNEYESVARNLGIQRNVISAAIAGLG